MRVIKLILHIVFYILIGLPLYLFWKIFNSFTAISEFLSLFPGYLGYFMRHSFYSLSLRSGKNPDIGFGTILQYDSIKLGHNVYVGQNCNIGKCSIGTRVKIGSNVHIVNKHTHGKDSAGNILPTDVKGLQRVHIGRNSWIGNNAVILADIGDNCVIGAGAVVVKPIPSDSRAVGNPATVK